MNGPHARNKKKLFPPNLKFFSLRPGYTKKYFFPLILAIILFIGLFVSYQLVRSKMNSPRAAQKNKQSFHLNLNNFSVRPGYAKKYFFPLILVIILFIGLFVPYQLVRSNVTAHSAGVLNHPGVHMCKDMLAAPFPLNFFPVTTRMEERVIAVIMD